jgi:hypothetical protein
MKHNVPEDSVNLFFSFFSIFHVPLAPLFSHVAIVELSEISIIKRHSFFVPPFFLTRSTQPSDCGQFGVSEKLTKCLPYGRYMAVLRLPTSCPRQPFGNWRKIAQKLPMLSVAEKLTVDRLFRQFLGSCWKYSNWEIKKTF